MAFPINLALTAVDLILSTQSADSVAILNQGTQVLQNCRPTRATVRQPSRILDHPLETGQIISDYSIILPLEIDLTVIVMALYYRSTAQQILQLFQTKQLSTVQLKDGNYVNMVIADIPREETPERFDAFQMVIKFRQVLVVQSTPDFNPADPTQASTQALGQQNSILAVPTSDNPFVQPTSATEGISYSSVQNFSSPDYGIVGISSATTTPSASVPTQGTQALTTQTSISSVFNGTAGGF